MKGLQVILMLFTILLYDAHKVVAQKVKDNFQEVIGVKFELGKSTMIDILRTLGPSSYVHLESQDEPREDYSSVKYPEDDGIVLEYEKEITLVRKHKCIISFYIEPKTSLVVQVVVTEQSQLYDIPVEEIIAVFGKPPRIIRQPVVVKDEVVGIVLDCDAGDEQGDFLSESLLYPQKGLEVVLDNQTGKELQKRFAQLVIYSFEILSGKKTFPKCK